MPLDFKKLNDPTEVARAAAERERQHAMQKSEERRWKSLLEDLRPYMDSLPDRERRFVRSAEMSVGMSARQVAWVEALHAKHCRNAGDTGPPAPASQSCASADDPVIFALDEDEGEISALGASVDEEVLGEIIRAQPNGLLHAVDQAGRPVLAYFDMDGDSLVIERGSSYSQKPRSQG